MATKNEMKRRDFLKIIGATTGVAATGCGKELPEKLIPYLSQPDDVIPGVASWYSGSCNECSAGCGVLVRTREGRVVKVEGNSNHPINRGGLCAHGQSALQGHYNPDRVREPLKRDATGAFKPISWKEAISEIATAIGQLPSNQRVALLTEPKSASAKILCDQFVSQLPRAEHVEYSFHGRAGLNAAAERCFGKGSRVQLDFSKANVIVNFGADFLETWVSPVEFARDWASRRKPSEENGEVSYFIHFEPRMSLTATSADRWVMNTPQSEHDILVALLKAVLDVKTLTAAPVAVRTQIASAVQGVSIKKQLAGTGVDEKTITSLAKALVERGPVLVVAGGSCLGEHAEEVQAIALLLNAVLGSIGQTVFLNRDPSTSQSSAQVYNLLDSMSPQNRSVGVLITAESNPAYTLPTQAGFHAAVANVPLVVRVSSLLDETAKLAHIVLPLSSSFESWYDSEPVLGVYNLNQPAMQRLYDSQSLGDTLLAIGAALDISFEGALSYYDFIRTQWKRRLGESNFEARWLRAVESGGVWDGYSRGGSQWTLTAEVVDSLRQKEKNTKAGDGLQLVAYPSVNSFDGQAANRPWMQELPNPMTSVVWGSWVELHPDTAKKHSIAEKDVVHVATAQGSLEAPVYLNSRLHPQVVAVPIGQGHLGYGRYATGVGMNALSILPVLKASASQPLISPVSELRKAFWHDELVRTQEFEEQYDRHILETVSASALDKSAHNHGSNGHDNGHGEDTHGGGHKEPGQMYRQMEHPQYKWGMSIDLASCTGCSACVVACYAENNIPVVGKELCRERREMSWIRIERYVDNSGKQPAVGFIPMLCQHCGNAPCEPVCPVYATYHNEEGLNAMVYNRCVGTRYCSNNCSYKVRRFNWFHYRWAEPLNWQLNPDVTVREVGVMEKCTFCVQRIREGQNTAKNLGRPVQDGEIQPACASSCPTKAITFGNLLDETTEVRKNSDDVRSYKVLDHHINTQPAVSYLKRVVNDKVELG